MTDLSQIRSKIEWGLNHVEEANRVLNRYINPIFYGAALSTKRDSKGRLLIKVTSLRKLDEDFALHIGDAAHNLRAALDHVVFAFASAEKKLSRDEEQNVQFPIYSSGPAFRGKSKRWLKHITRRRVLTLIERLQPYHRKKWPETNLLAILNAINVWDKHRALSIAFIKVKRAEYTCIVTSGDSSYSYDVSYSGPLKLGTIIARLPVPKGLRNPKVKVKVKSMVIVPAFDSRMQPELFDISVINTLRKVAYFFRGVVIPRFESLG